MYSQLLPCRHPDNKDSSYISSKYKLQTFDWNELSLLRTLTNEDTNLLPQQFLQ